MKKYLVIIGCLLFMGISSCKKHDTLPKVPAPAWTTDNTGKYPASMTAVVRMPDVLQRFVQKGDQLGAFVGDQCRGKGLLLTVDSVEVFFILINGTASEQSKVSFQYYSSWKSHLYQTDAFLDFTVDGNYGTADGPEILDLKPVK